MGSLKIAINVMREKGNKWVGETINNGLKIPMGKDQEKWAEGDNHKWVGDANK